MDFGILRVKDQWYLGWLTRTLSRESDDPPDYDTTSEFKAGYQAADDLAESARAIILLREIQGRENIWVDYP